MQLEISIPSLEVLNKPFKFIDIREIEEVENEPLSDKIKSNALHIPLSKWQKSQHLLPEEAWVLVCASGKRSLILAEKLSSIGKQDVYSLSGGLS